MEPRRKSRRQNASLGPEESADLKDDSLSVQWAVSYTDLLMVLLSFFVIYFQFNDVLNKPMTDEVILALKSGMSVVDLSKPQEKGESIFGRPGGGAGGKGTLNGTLTAVVGSDQEAAQKQVLCTQGAGKCPVGGTGSGVASGEATGTGSGTGIFSRFFGRSVGLPGGTGESEGQLAGGLPGQGNGTGIAKGINRLLSSNKENWASGGMSHMIAMTIPLGTGEVAVEKLPDGGVVVHLSDNIFNMGQFKLNKSAENELAKVLNLLKPYESKLSLTFVGHTDKSPVTHKLDKDNAIRSNIDLSSMRASQAVGFAVEKGFSPKWSIAQGMAEYGRDSRSLSIQIHDRKKAQP